MTRMPSAAGKPRPEGCGQALGEREEGESTWCLVGSKHCFQAMLQAMLQACAQSNAPKMHVRNGRYLTKNHHLSAYVRLE